jgi:hypothetical protein
MMKIWTRKPASLGLGVAATLVAAVVGCGGQGTETSDAVVVPDSTAVNSAPAAKSSAPAAGNTASSAPTATPSAAPVKAEGYGTLKGKITFGGEAAAPKVLFEQGKAPKDPEVCAKDGPILNESLLVDSGSKGVKNVLVFLPKPTSVSDDAKKAQAGAKVVFDQIKCVFEPHVLGIMTGSPITLKSSDPVNHNINAKLKQSPFNQLLAGMGTAQFPPNGAERTPGEVTCDIHPWMKAYWMVLDHPYFAVTGTDGSFEIKDAPAGTQRVVVWQESVDKGGFVTSASGEEVVIKPNDTVTKDWVIDAGRIRAAQ